MRRNSFASEIISMIQSGDLDGVVITNEDLQDEWMPDRSELEEMDDNTAAILAGHLFTRLTGVRVDNQHCSGCDHEEQAWEGTTNEYFWTIEKYEDEYLVSLSVEE